jgi:ABC-type enterochelin transport system ATPase subunit
MHLFSRTSISRMGKASVLPSSVLHVPGNPPFLQRLYQPNSGSISIGENNIAFMDVTHLPHHISVVSQNPNLFDTAIAENRYGNGSRYPESCKGRERT